MPNAQNVEDNVELNVRLLQEYHALQASELNQNEAKAMQELGLQPGCLQDIQRIQDYTCVLVFDFRGVVMALKYLGRDESCIYSDATMYGNMPRIRIGTTTIEDKPGQYGFHSVINLFIDKGTDFQLEDSRSIGNTPEAEIHIHHKKSSGIPFTIYQKMLSTYKEKMCSILSVVAPHMENPPPDLCPRAVEIDFGGADIKTWNAVYPLCNVIHERYHALKIAFNCITFLKNEGGLENDSICSNMLSLIRSFFATKSQTQAVAMSTKIKEIIEAYIASSSVTTEKKAEMRAHFGHTIAKLLLDNTKAVCDYGRNQLGPKRAPGPIAENVNKQAQIRNGKIVQTPCLAMHFMC